MSEQPTPVAPVVLSRLAQAAQFRQGVIRVVIENNVTPDPASTPPPKE